MKMLPPFDQHGYLPPGVHLATLDEIKERFGMASELRRAQMQSIDWLVPLCRDARVERLVLNGSFVTDVPEPNDVDSVLLPGPAYDVDSPAGIELEDGLPFLQLEIVEEAEFDELVHTIFASDRTGVRKGVVELRL